MRKQYTLNLTTIEPCKTFESLEIGECFTIPGGHGMGAIWVGFPVLIKTGEGEARDIECGDIRTFTLESPIARVIIGSVDRPS